jgi:uncharacterized membrane protein YgcG
MDDALVDGVVDTVRLSRMYINWADVAALPMQTRAHFVGPAVLEEGEEEEEEGEARAEGRLTGATNTVPTPDSEDVGDVETTAASQLTATDEADFRAIGEAIKRGKIAGNSVATKVDHHNLGSCHTRLFGAGLGDHAHEASADAEAVVAILSHPAVWPLLTGRDVWRPVRSIVKHADALYAAEINRVRGWRREYRPVCEHGVMLTTVVAVHEELERSMYPDGHKVVFKCRMRFKPCRDPVENPTYPGYVVTAVAKVSRPSSKTPTGGVPKGTVGACECTSMCVRGCPCKNAGQKCGDSCRNHQRATCKCKNLAEGLGGGSSSGGGGGGSAGGGGSGPPAGTCKGRAAAQRRARRRSEDGGGSEGDSEGDSDSDSDSEGDSEVDDSDGSNSSSIRSTLSSGLAAFKSLFGFAPGPEGFELLPFPIMRYQLQHMIFPLPHYRAQTIKLVGESSNL